MDRGWFLYCEEIDYCYRLRALGIRSVLVPRSQVLHLGGGSHRHLCGVKACIDYYHARNEIELARRYAGSLVWQCIALKKLLRALLSLVSGDRLRANMVFAAVNDARRRRLGKTFSPENFLH
jgi:GT2 family glycosyltransferase